MEEIEEIMDDEDCLKDITDVESYAPYLVDFIHRNARRSGDIYVDTAILHRDMGTCVMRGPYLGLFFEGDGCLTKSPMRAIATRRLPDKYYDTDALNSWAEALAEQLKLQPGTRVRRVSPNLRGGTSFYIIT
jgi:hypothetical protein